MSNDIYLAIKNVQVAKSAEPELAKLKKATDGFEAIFLKKLFSQMRAGIKETQFGDSPGKAIYEDMFDEAMANSASKSKTLGMGDMLYRQFSPRIVAQVRQAFEKAHAHHTDLSTTDPKGQGN
jgi:flagellar protein FlgJ